MKRVWDVIVGVTMIVLSLLVEMLVLLPLAFPYYAVLDALHIEEHGMTYPILLLVVVALVNGVACYDYFHRRVANTGLGSTSSAFFLFPRGLDRVVNGVESISRG